MAKRKRVLPITIFVLIFIGSIGFLNVTRKDRYKAFHAVDVLQLVATGMCYGVALAGIVAVFRKPNAG